jgi:hypothetical protein
LRAPASPSLRSSLCRARRGPDRWNYLALSYPVDGGTGYGSKCVRTV